MTLDRIAGRRAAILGLFVAVSVLTRAPFLSVPYLDLDEAAALVGARELISGGTLYVDVADNRQPLLYGFYALALTLLGPGLASVRLLVAVAVVPLTAFAASAFYRHDRQGIVAGLLYVVYGAAGRLFVWGFAPQIYAEADLRPAARFVVPQASLTGYVPGNRASRTGAVDTRSLVREDHWDLLMGNLERSQPAFVADTAPSGLHGWGLYPLAEFPRLQAFVKSRYDAIAVVDGVWIWRRRGCETLSGW